MGVEISGAVVVHLVWDHLAEASLYQVTKLMSVLQFFFLKYITSDFGPEFYKNEDEAKRILGVKTSTKALEERKKQQKMMSERGRGRGGRGANRGRGAWWGRGRGMPPGFHFGYTEDDDGTVIYNNDHSSSSERGKKKKKHRRSYSSYR